ncbi:core histone macro-H2A.1 [Trichonephila clavipes]|nr:core histone macro-H2A.1 [Trichonephila clavipes]
MSEWDYTNERVLFWMDLNGDFDWVCSTITSQNIYGRAPTIILLTMRPSRLFVKIRCHAVPSTRKRSAVRNASSSRVRKRVSKGNFPRLEQCLVSWMRQCRGQNMGGSLLKEKAKAFAKELGIQFSASEGWLTNFNKRNVG